MRRARTGCTAPLLLLAAHLCALVPLLHTILLTYQLPNSFQARYNVYQNVETARARILLPFKSGSFPILATDAQFATDTDVVEDILLCQGTADVGGGFQVPEWLLETDEQGMGRLAETLVRSSTAFTFSICCSPWCCHKIQSIKEML